MTSNQTTNQPTQAVSVAEAVALERELDAMSSAFSDYIIGMRETLKKTQRHLAIATQGLLTIADGAGAEGCWVGDSEDALGHDPAAPDEGYYDSENPPEGYDKNGFVGWSDKTREEPTDDEELLPAEWSDYSLEEQSVWLKTCAYVAKTALVSIGASLPITEGA
jgi:hypothetical protein